MPWIAALTVGLNAPWFGAAQALPAAGGTQLWEARYDGPGHGSDYPSAVAVSPDGTKVVVTGQTVATTPDYGTIAYDSSTGSVIWGQRYDGHVSADEANAVEVSPDNSTVFVTGYVNAVPAGNTNYTTIAYNLATGVQTWLSTYNAPANSSDKAYALAISPDGTKVFVTGTSRSSTSGDDAATIAYNSATGVQLWEARYTSAGNAVDSASSVAVTPDGSTVFVTGSTTNPAADTDYLTIAYDSTTGIQKWTRTYGSAFGSDDTAKSVGVSPDSSKVYVTGYIFGSPDFANYVTLTYDAAAGTTVWQKRYRGPVSSDFAQSLAVSPNGSRIFVTGYSEGSTTNDDYATVAYDASTGALKWGRRYNGPGNGQDQAYSVGVSPDGSKVFVTGLSDFDGTGSTEYATLSYDAVTGSQLWVSAYKGPTGTNNAQALAVAPDGAKVYVTGYSNSQSLNLADYLTVAYEA